MDPVEAALLCRGRERGYVRPNRAASNARSDWSAPFLQPVSEAPAAAVRAAWEPVRAGQSVPMIGEERRRG